MNIEIANRLVQLRKANNLSQEDLAGKIGVSRQAVSKWERAESSPDTDNLILLSKIYGISLNEMLASDEDPELPIKTMDESSVLPKEDIAHRFPYPLVVVIIYLMLGFFADAWHPAWLLFLTIPIYYSIVGTVKRR